MTRRSLALALVAAVVAVGSSGGVGRGGTPRVKTGLDVLRAKGFAPLEGKKVGVLVNATARASEDGAFLVDLLRARKDLTLVTIFSPEHGLEAKKDELVASGTYEGIPVVSLYGERKKPTVDELRAVDVLVYDIQDVGARYYTYLASLAMAMEVAKEAKTKVLVLDRPDPAGGEVVEGPILVEGLRKRFTSWSAIPVRYGLTIGEYARWVNEVEKLGCDLEVVKMEGWKRSQLWADTGLPWRNPSPNLRSADAGLLYTGLGLLEQTNLSVGRGTEEPFLLYGAPFVDGGAWARALEARKLGGLRFEAAEFTPTASAHAKKKCSGVRVTVTDAKKVRTVATALAMIETLAALTGEFKFAEAGGMLGRPAAMKDLARGASAKALLEDFAKEHPGYLRARRPVLLYE